MKLLIISDKPTQFDAPFFRYITASDTSINLHLLYTSTSYSLYDPELLQNISWGVNLLEGYTHTVLTTRNRFLQLCTLIRSSNYIIISGYSSLPAIIAYVLCFLLHKRCAIRLDTVDWHNQSRIKLALYKKPLFKVLNVICCHFLACGSRTHNFLTMVNIKEEKINRFPYIVDTNWFATTSVLSVEGKQKLKQTLQIPAGNIIILAVTKLNSRESPFDLLNALALMTHQRVTVVIIGDGENKPDLIKLSNTLPPTKQVIFLGYVPYTSLPSYYGIADLFVHPVQDEPWGVSVQEAMACRLPVITSNFVGAGYDLIKPGENGFMYSFGQPHDLAQRADEALDLTNEQVNQTNCSILQFWSYDTLWNELRTLILEN